jgi:hypothetical protein
MKDLRLLKKTGTTVDQALLLQFLRENGRSCQAEFSAWADMSRTLTSRLFVHCVRLGWVHVYQKVKRKGFGESLKHYELTELGHSTYNSLF